MVVKFYYNLASPPARTAYFTIKHLDIPVELVEIDVTKGEIKSENYLKVSFYNDNYYNKSKTELRYM